LPETDLWADGFGLGWGHKRTFGNRLVQSWDRGNGWNWFIENWPYFVSSPYAGTSLAMLGDINDVFWFAQNVDGTYATLYGRLEVLTHDVANGVFNLLSPDGTVATFFDLSHATRPGAFKKITSPGGNTTEVFASSGGDILEVQRSSTIGGTTTTESFLYSFLTSGANYGHLDNVLLRRQINGGAWTNVRRAQYAYYGDGENFGTINDLKTVTRQTWDGSNWVALGTSYYRYYKSGDANGFVNGLRYALNAEAFAKLSAAVANPFTATNAEVAQFADYYFEYDSQRRVVKETVAAGSRTFTFAFTDSSFSDGMNRWKRKTVETKPDGTQTIVYTNYIGLTMLELEKSGTDQWYRFTTYDDVGRALLTAESSAVTGYDETKPDLLNYDPVTGKYQFLSDANGLLHVFNYYAATGSGGAQGYLQYEKIKHGQTGAEIKLRRLEYTSHTANGFTVFPVSKEIAYPDDTNDTITITTSYDYTFHAGTNQIERKTTTYPVISAAQNGSGAANSQVEIFDLYGNRTWLKNERGFLTRYQYDVPTGALRQQIDDVDTAQVTDEPAGWSTPTGGGLHLITDLEFDALGRTTQDLGPVHTLDIAGTATTARDANWTVYDDVNATTRVGRGYATGTAPAYSYTLINPVQITKFDKNGSVLEEIEATRASTSGRLVPSDTFAQSTYTRWTTHQYSDCCKLVSTRVYHAIPASGSGTSGTNYDQTDFGYDVMDRRNRIVTPGGTITRTVYEARGLPTAVWVGTNDTGATASNPAGSGPPNNMVQVTANQFDSGVAGGDGNLTRQTKYVDGSTSRVTSFGYDWRNRRISTDGEVDVYEKRFYDNLDRLTKVDRHDTTASGNLIARSETRYDDLSRVYRTITYGVDPATGSVGNSLADNTWYDAAGNILKQLPSGSKLFLKFVYDGLDRAIRQYTGYDLAESSYADAGTITGDTILEQTETTFDPEDNVIQTVLRERYHNATGTGELTGPGGTQPKARVTYAAAWHDAAGRTIASAAYGTNGGTALSRPATVPARSDTVLVSSTEFNSRGETYKQTDPAGTVTLFEFDDAGRRKELPPVEQFQQLVQWNGLRAGRRRQPHHAIRLQCRWQPRDAHRPELRYR
jgi:hypothetical protein